MSEAGGSLANLGRSQEVILGGVNDVGSDVLEGNEDDDILLGDNGELIYDVDNDLSTLDLIQSLPFASDGITVLGGADTISGNASSDTILGGVAGDTIHGGDATGPSIADGSDILLGDNGEVVLTGGVVAQIRTTDDSETTGGADNISGNVGNDIMRNP